VPAERLMGIETEYAISEINPSHAYSDHESLVNALLDVARRNLIHLPDLGNGLYLENGSRFYVDYGNHPELSTPECANPWDLVRYILAGERILANLIAQMKREYSEREVMLFKSNVDYGGGWVTWGCHESYMYRGVSQELSGEIVPHLVSRIIYTGSGGFNSFSSGLEFTLSPRVPHLQNVVSNNSTSARGIFHTKDESLSKPGFRRLHVICGESLCSEISMWLKVGTTALVVAMAEAGLCPGAGVGLRYPLEAMHTIAGDPSCSATVEMTTGRRLSALEIQYHYLNLAEKNLDSARMPPWADEVCREWRAMLNRLLDAPDSVATTLDWAIKQALYESYASSRGVEWALLPHWAKVLTALRADLDATEDYSQRFTAEFILHPSSPIRDRVQAWTSYLTERGLSWNALGSVLELRKELLEIDTRFGQLCGGGIFSSLDSAGVLTHHLPGIEAIEKAMIDPPEIGRARLRGEVVRRMAKEKARCQCDWQGIADLKAMRVLDLSDPFETEERWLVGPQAYGNWPSVFTDLFLRVGARDSTTYR
jgi:proteasome accessory factor A